METDSRQAEISEKGFRMLLSGHPWIYRDELESPSKCSDGDIVNISHRGRFLGKAFYSDRSKISLRIITRNDERIDREFWAGRILAALRRREKVIGSPDAYRLIFSESDGIPSTIVDRYGSSFSVQSLSRGSDRMKKELAEILVELFHPLSIFERNDVSVRQLEGLDEEKGELYGRTPDRIEIQEGSIKLLVDIKGGQKTGAYLDQRENRIHSERFFTGSVLDCFSYQGAYALHAARTADQVIAVETSGEALQIAQENADLNTCRNIIFEQSNAFDYLKRMTSSGKRFDAIILDPPAFAKSKADVPNAKRAYMEINVRALKLLKPGGFLLTSSCSYNLSETEFLEIIRKASARARVSVHLIDKRMQPPDHPFLATFPESYYLKSFILTVI